MTTTDTAADTAGAHQGFAPPARMLALFEDMTEAVQGLPAGLDREHADLLGTLRTARALLRHTLRGLDDAQAVQRPTVSALTPAGLVKHVAATEAQWARFLEVGAAAMQGGQEYADGFTLEEGETVAGVLEEYARVAARTDAVVAALPDLDADQQLPDAPWFPEGLRWSARRVVLHLVAETTQHAGHADILRESVDGARSMG